MNDKIKKYIIPNLPYAFIGVLIGNLGEAYRLAAGADIGQKLMGLMQTTGPAFENLLPGPYLFDWLVALMGGVLLRVFVWQKSKKARKFRRDMEYGSARWSA